MGASLLKRSRASFALAVIVGAASVVRGDSGITIVGSFDSADGSSPEGQLLLLGNTFYGTTVNGGTNANTCSSGAVFSIPVSGGTPTLLGSFDGTNGNSPVSGLVAVGNTLYGTTANGGQYGYGTVFSIPETGGTPKVLTSFNYGDGANPAGLTVVGNTLFGLTTYGGTYSDGTVFSLPITGGTPKVLKMFNGPNGGGPQGTPIISNNVLYASAYGGGASDDGTIVGVPLNGGALRLTASFNGADGQEVNGNLLLSGNTIYGTTNVGGTTQGISDGSLGVGAIYSVPVTGGTPTVLGSFDDSDGFPSTGVTQVGKTLYGTFSGDDVYGVNLFGGVYSIPITGGTPTIVAVFNGSNGEGPSGGLSLVGNRLYGTTGGGGTSGFGTLFSVPVTTPVTFTGNGDGFQWKDSNNWTNNGVAGLGPDSSGLGNDITFSSYAYQLQLGGNQTANSLTFSSYSVIGSTTSSNVLTLSSGLVTVPSYGYGDIESTLNTSALTLLGNGQLELDNPNNKISSITIGSPNIFGYSMTPFFEGDATDFPVLSFTDDRALDHAPITLMDGRLQENLSEKQTLTQSISVQGTSVYDASVSLGTILVDDSYLSISGQLYVGSGCTLEFNGSSGTSLALVGSSPASSLAGSFVQVDDGLQLNLDKSKGVNAIPGTSLVVYGSTVQLQADDQTLGTLDVSLQAIYGQPGVLDLNGHTTTIGALSGDSTSVVMLGAGRLFVGGDSASSSFLGSITGTGSLVKIGGGVLALGGSSSFTGSLNISSGAIEVDNSAAVGTTASINVQSGATLILNGDSISCSKLSIGGLGVGGAGALVNTNISNASISGPVTLVSQTGFSGAGNITLSGPVTGSGGIVQLGDNSLTLTRAATFTGGLNIDNGMVSIAGGSSYSGGINLGGGMLSVNADSGLGSSGNRISFSNGGTLQATASFTTARSFTSSNGGIDLLSGVTVTDSGTLSGSGPFTQTGAGTWRMTASSPFAGSLVLAGGTLSLAGTSGALADVDSIDLITTGTLELNSSTALGGNQTNENRINNAAPITLDGGTLSVIGANGHATAQTLGELIPHFGASTISLKDGSTADSSVTVTFASLGGSSAGATISLDGSSLGSGEKVLFQSGVANGTVFGGGVTVNGTDFANYSSALGVIPFATSDYSFNAFKSGTNVRLQPSVTSPSIPGKVGTISVQTLNIDADAAAVNLNLNAGSTLTLTNGGLIKSGSYPASISGGTLTTGSGELDISVQGGSLNLSSALSGSFVLTKRGSGTLALTGDAASTYTGFTLVSGEMDLNKSAGSIAIPGNLIVDGGTLKSLASGQIAPSADVTLNYGTWDLNHQTENIAQLNNVNGTMLFHGGTLNVSSGVTLAGGHTTVASTLNSAALLTVSGGDNEVHADGVISTTAMALLGTNPTVQLYSDASMPGELILKNGASVSFLGSGTAQLASIGNAASSGTIDLGGTNHVFNVKPGDTFLISAALVNGGFSTAGGGTIELTGVSSSATNSSYAITLGNATTLQATNTTSLFGNLNFAGGTLSLQSDLGTSIYPASALNTVGSTSATINLAASTAGIPAGVFEFQNSLNTFSGSAFTLNGSGSLMLGGVNIQYNPAASNTWYIHNATNLTITSGITASGQPSGSQINVVKDQPGILTLASNNQSEMYGNMTVNAGKLVLDQTDQGDSVAIPNGLTVANGAVVQWDLPSEVNPNSAVVVNGATGNSLLDLNGNSQVFSNLSFIAGGTLTTGTGQATLAGNLNVTGIAGTAVINGNLDLGASTPTFNISSSATVVGLRINADILGDTASIGINKTGPGVLYLAGTNSFNGGITISAGTVKVDQTPAGAIVIRAGGVFDFDATTTNGILQRNVSSITLAIGAAPLGQLNVLSAPSSASRQLIITTGLTLAGSVNAWQGKVDLANNDLEVKSGSLAILTNQIKEGYGSSLATHWNGSAGIVSSTAGANTSHLTALGIVENNQNGSDIFSNSQKFDGIAPAPTDVLIKYTLYGDTNLDGKVDSTDIARVTASIKSNAVPKNVQLTGWYNGDFNYDGVINGSDMTLLDNSLNAQTTQLISQLANPTAQVTDQIAGVNQPSTVPEPASLSLCVPAIALLARRRPTPKR